eukprot:GHVU01028749.1.p2 GENE.GHVU01028749.1~~GHVU01028749.1.p2  ORF type:complete len:123 (-),score=7.87 GHVU01028749.1:2024-2392(-)
MTMNESTLVRQMKRRQQEDHNRHAEAPQSLDIDSIRIAPERVLDRCTGIEDEAMMTDECDGVEVMCASSCAHWPRELRNLLHTRTHTQHPPGHNPASITRTRTTRVHTHTGTIVSTRAHRSL